MDRIVRSGYNKCSFIVLMMLLAFMLFDFETAVAAEPALLAEVCESADMADWRFSGSLSLGVASAGLSPSGGLYDTLPEATQVIDCRQGLGGYGYLDGFLSVYSSLHDRQHETHRAIFNDMDGDVCYGYDVKLGELFSLQTKGGPYFDVPMGYRGAHMKCWGPIVFQRLDNPYVTPYWGGLWLLEPQRKGRVRAGLRKKFEISDNLTVSLFVEGVWMDRRRFYLKYGGEPEKGVIGGGAVAFILSGVSLDWKITDCITLYASYTQYDLVNSQARSLVRERGRYCDKCDWPIARIGMSYSF